MTDALLPAAAGSAEMAKLLEPFAGQEFASEALSELLWPTTIGGFQELPHPSRILWHHEWGRFSFGSGSAAGWPAFRLGSLYDRMLEDDTDLAGLWDKRLKALLQLPRFIRPAD